MNIPEVESQELDLVWSCLNTTAPTTYQALVARVERKTGCQLAGLGWLNQIGAALVTAGRAKIVRRNGVVVGVVRV